MQNAEFVQDRTMRNGQGVDANRIRPTVSPDRLPSFGVLSGRVRDNIYYFGMRGVLFTSPWVTTGNTQRQAATLLLSASGRPMELCDRDRRRFCSAAIVPPLCPRSLRAVDVGLISVNIQPDHPRYRAFVGISDLGVRPLSREAFSLFDVDLARAYEGRLSHREGEQLFENLIDHAAGLVGACKEVWDRRAAALQAFLHQRPDCSLVELAAHMNVSYTSASHLFSRVIGVPLRSYQHWRKCLDAVEHFRSNMTLTEIAQTAGFSDSAHFTNSWRRRYGLTPSYLRDSRHTRIFD